MHQEIQKIIIIKKKNIFHNPGILFLIEYGK